jgi:hypothetical protein
MFLRKKDYYRSISVSNLQALIDGGADLLSAEGTAISEISSYLRNRYDVSAIFAFLFPYEKGVCYNAGTRLYVTAPEYDAEANYEDGDLVLIGNGIFIIDGGQPLDEKLCLNEAVFSVLQDTDANTPIDDIAFFVEKDSRDPLILTDVVDVALYHLHKSVSPNQIPQTRFLAYDGNDPRQTGGVIGRLKNVNAGRIQLDLPLLNPASHRGYTIRYGGELPKNNSF